MRITTFGSLAVKHLSRLTSNKKRHPGWSDVPCVNDGAERYGSLLPIHRQFPAFIHHTAGFCALSIIC